MTVIKGISGQDYKLEAQNKNLLQLFETLTAIIDQRAKEEGKEPKAVWDGLFGGGGNEATESDNFMKMINGAFLLVSRVPALVGTLMEPYDKAGPSPDLSVWDDEDTRAARGRVFLADTGPKDLRKVVTAFFESPEAQELRSWFPTNKEETDEPEPETPEDTVSS